MANAKFKISGSLSIEGGYDATHDEVLELQLEDQPPVDVFKCQYTIGQFTPDAPTPTFGSPMGIASPVGSIVELTMPGSGIHLYELTCTVNNGKDAEGKPRADYVSSRIVAIRSDQGLRKILAGETTEYDANQGWATAVNEIVEEIDTLGTGMGGMITTVTGTTPITVNNTNPNAPVVGISAATTSNAGSMSASDKTKLDGIGAGATVVSVSVTAPITIGGTTANPTIGISAASIANAGSMSASDKAKLDSITTPIPAWDVDAEPDTIVLRDPDGCVNATCVKTSDGSTLPAPTGLEAPHFKLDTAISGLLRSCPLDWRGYFVGGVESWITTLFGTCKQNVIDAEAECYVQLDIPHGVQLEYFGVKTKGAGSNPAPGNLPAYNLIRQNMNTLAQTIVAGATDAGGGSYRATHWTVVDCSMHTVDRTAYRYYLQIQPETGTNSEVGFQLDAAYVQYTLPAGYSIGLN